MSPFNLDTCARPNILRLKPYSCARDDYKDDGSNVLLDANENAYGPSLSSESISSCAAAHSFGKASLGTPQLDLLGLHRYPDPHQNDLKAQLCSLRSYHKHSSRNLTPDNLFVGVGSDEAIDSLLRCFCEPNCDKILVCPPTYGMYAVSADINAVSLVKVPLLPAPGFGLDVPAILRTLSSEQGSHIKLAYFCTPGNPTGSLLSKHDVAKVLAHPTWNGIVVLDEAYIDFAQKGSSLAEWVLEFPNLVVVQTLSKAFGMAGIRLGAAFCAPPVARLLNSLKAPYNISSPTSALAQLALSPEGLQVLSQNREKIITQRARLLRELLGDGDGTVGIEGVGRLRGGTDSNFVLVEILNQAGKADNETALEVYKRLAEEQGVVVRFRGNEHGCTGCLRITVGTEAEVTRLLDSLKRVLRDVRQS